MSVPKLRLLAEGQSQKIEVHTNPMQSAYTMKRISTEGYTAYLDALPKFRAELSALFPG